VNGSVIIHVDGAQIAAAGADFFAGGISEAFNNGESGIQNLENAKIIWYSFRKHLSI